MRADLLSGDGVNSNHFGDDVGVQLVVVGGIVGGGIGYGVVIDDGRESRLMANLMIECGLGAEPVWLAGGLWRGNTEPGFSRISYVML